MIFYQYHIIRMTKLLIIDSFINYETKIVINNYWSMNDIMNIKNILIFNYVFIDILWEVKYNINFFFFLFVLIRNFWWSFLLNISTFDLLSNLRFPQEKWVTTPWTPNENIVVLCFIIVVPNKYIYKNSTLGCQEIIMHD